MRWLKRIGVVLVVVVLVAGAFGVWTVRRSFPQVSGELRVPGLEAPVTVYRDDWGIPHFYATTTHDLFFAQGFVHAQERFWQMDFWRHIGAGRLSELFGESQVDTDVFLRSLGFTEIARQELAMMDLERRSILESYADGVNAYLAERDGAALSLEYAVLGLQNQGYEVEPWHPLHTLTWAKVMSWDLGANLRDEIDRVVFGRYLSATQVEELYPPYPDDAPVIVAEDSSGGATVPATLPEDAFAALSRARAAVVRLDELTGGGFEGIGSNSWVVSGSRTTTGDPILANDTHLAIQMPAIWFVNGLHCVEVGPECPDDIAGLSFAGAPGVVVGHNGRLAWGVTNQAVDTQDLFVERVDPDDPTRYEVDGEWVEFERRSETIRVAGGEDVVFDVLGTRHGPVISDTLLEPGELEGSSALELPDGYVVALAWQSLEPSTVFEALLEMGRAENHQSFREALELWDIAPQNVVYADVVGNIAYHSTGEIPIRAAGDGRYPVPGWSGEYDWVGLVPFEDLPRVFNPDAGLVVAANNPVLRPGSEPYFGETTNRGYRAERIASLLENAGELDPAAMRRIQMDTFDVVAARVVPLLLEMENSDEGVLAIQGTLRDWASGVDAFSASGESAGAAAWMATWRHLLAGVFADDVPEDLWPSGGDRWALAVTRLLEEPESPWWDHGPTPAVETRDDVLVGAMRAAHSELVGLMGASPSSWSWGRLHVARFANQSFGVSGIGPVEWLFNRSAPRRVGGSSTLVNAVGWDASVGYEVDWIPSFRLVVDLGDLGRSTVMHSTGQSGHAFHHHYDDMIEAWADGVQAPLHWTRAAVENAARTTLRLLPGG